MRKFKPASRSFGFESLEPRTVLNGTVAATNLAGALTLTGDGAKNVVLVHQVGTNIDGGAIVQVQGDGTKIDNLDTSTIGNFFTFGGGASLGITSIDINLGGGADVLTFYNTTVSGEITVNMDDPASGGIGDGNDVLVMSNVHAETGTVTITLGNGTNVASIFRVTSGSDFSLTGGNGRDIVALNSVQSNTSPITANDTLIVDLEGGNFDTLTVVN